MPVERKSVLLYGGSFDPPHLGHATAIYCSFGFSKTKPSEVWLLPCNTDIFGAKTLSDPKDRIAMLRLFIDRIRKETGITVMLNTTEIDTNNDAGTYAIVRNLIDSYPQIDFSYLIGSDQANHIRRWRNSRNLLKLIRMVVVNRKYYHLNKSWVMHKPHECIQVPPDFALEAKCKDDDISSTNIRRYYEENPGTIIRHKHIYPAVAKYISVNKLYRKKD